MAGCGDSKDANPGSREERQPLLDEADAAALESVQELVATRLSPCSIPTADPNGSQGRGYLDIPALVNDVDLIFEGEVVGANLAVPRPGTLASRVLVDVRPTRMLLGEAPSEVITLDAGGRVMKSGESFVRLEALIDFCSTNEAVLFVKRTADAGVYQVAAQGFVASNGEDVVTSGSDGLFSEFSNLADIRSEIAQAVEDQNAAGLAKGFLACEPRKSPQDFEGIPACPGELLHPYQDFGLARVLEAYIILSAPSDAPTSPVEIRLDPKGEDFRRLLETLDTELLLASYSFVLEDVIRVGVVTTTTGSPPYSHLLLYSPGAGVIQLPGSGQFVAPEGFGAALNAILEGS